MDVHVVFFIFHLWSHTATSAYELQLNSIEEIKQRLVDSGKAAAVGLNSI